MECPVCAANITAFTFDQQSSHVNRCLDDDDIVQRVVLKSPSACPVCKKSGANNAAHIKSCARAKCMDLRTVLNVVENHGAASPSNFLTELQKQKRPAKPRAKRVKKENAATTKIVVTKRRKNDTVETVDTATSPIRFASSSSSSQEVLEIDLTAAVATTGDSNGNGKMSKYFSFLCKKRFFDREQLIAKARNLTENALPNKLAHSDATSTTTQMPHFWSLASLCDEHVADHPLVGHGFEKYYN